jgi:hypothetical protein
VGLRVFGMQIEGAMTVFVRFAVDIIIKIVDEQIETKFVLCDKYLGVFLELSVYWIPLRD